MKQIRRRDMLGLVVGVALLGVMAHDIYIEDYIAASIDVLLALLLIVGPTYEKQ